MRSPGQDSYDFFVESKRAIAQNWRNEVTLKSIEMLNEYEPGAMIHRISPTPLLMLVAKQDAQTDIDLVLKAYEQALQPKDLVLLDGGALRSGCQVFRAFFSCRSRMVQ